MKSPHYQPQKRKWLAWIISLLALAAIMWQVSHHEAISEQSFHWLQILPKDPILLGIVALLIPINWGIEAVKWHLLLGRQNQSFGHAFRTVIVGSTWGFLTPNRSGDAAGRLALLPANQRKIGLRAFGWSAWAQGGMTLTFGGLAWAWCSELFEADHASNSMMGIQKLQTLIGFNSVWAIPSVAILGAALWWILGWANVQFGSAVLGKLSRLFTRPSWMVDNPQGTSPEMRKKLPLVVTLSGVRYGVFATQFVFGLWAYGFAEMPLLMPAIALVYWGNMIIPTAALAEVGVREALIVMLLQPQPEMTAPLIAATFSVWALNLVVPAAIGAFIGPNLLEYSESKPAPSHEH
jgi:hypothetical protein